MCPQLGLFDNPVGAFSLQELAETVRALESERPGRTERSTADCRSVGRRSWWSADQLRNLGTSSQ